MTIEVKDSLKLNQKGNMRKEPVTNQKGNMRKEPVTNRKKTKNRSEFGEAVAQGSSMGAGFVAGPFLLIGLLALGPAGIAIFVIGLLIAGLIGIAKLCSEEKKQG